MPTIQKMSKIVNAAIISSVDGKKIGKVKDIILDSMSRNVLAFLVRDYGMFQSAKVVPYASAQSVSSYGVVVPNKKSIVGVSNDVALRLAVRDKNKIRGKRLLDQSGNEIGTVGDLSFDVETGEVVDIEKQTGNGKGATFPTGESTINVDRIIQVDMKSVRVRRDLDSMPPEVIDENDTTSQKKPSEAQEKDNVKNKVLYRAPKSNEEIEEVVEEENR